MNHAERLYNSLTRNVDLMFSNKRSEAEFEMISTRLWQFIKRCGLDEAVLAVWRNKHPF